MKENIICLNEVEAETFLPNDLLDKVKELLGSHRCVNPEELDGEAEWQEILRKCNPEILVAAWATPTLPADLPQLAPNFRYVCYLPGSVRNLIPRSILESGIHVTNWSGSVSRTVAECAILLTLCCMRRVRYWTEEMHLKGGWKTSETVTQSLFERRVGIHGFGLIAQETAKLLQPFTPHISAFSPSVPEEIFRKLGVSRCDSLERLFSESDVIIELAALTEHNQKIITEALLRSLPDGAAFVNVGRGAVVDEEALARVAAEKDLQVALDVYGVEPLPKDSPFRGMPNVMLLPHLAGPTTDRRQDAGSHALENLRRYLQGEPLLDELTVGMYDRAS